MNWQEKFDGYYYYAWTEDIHKLWKNYKLYLLQNGFVLYNENSKWILKFRAKTSIYDYEIMRKKRDHILNNR